LPERSRSKDGKEWPSLPKNRDLWEAPLHPIREFIQSQAFGQTRNPPKLEERAVLAYTTDMPL